MLIAGDKESEAGLISVRDRQQGDLGAMTPDAFLELLATKRPPVPEDF
jgi:threonyl-tRNA synthetase